jgi:hypothetical protein
VVWESASLPRLLLTIWTNVKHQMAIVISSGRLFRIYFIENKGMKKYSHGKYINGMDTKNLRLSKSKISSGEKHEKAI